MDGRQRRLPQVTQYGGDAPVPGLPERQIRADQHTAEILPLRADNFWFLHFVNEGRTLHYGVHWPTLGHSVRLAFDLSSPIAPPPAPWGYQWLRITNYQLPITNYSFPLSHQSGGR